jgi:hypothetical protein
VNLARAYRGPILIETVAWPLQISSSSPRYPPPHDRNRALVHAGAHASASSTEAKWM